MRYLLVVCLLAVPAVGQTADWELLVAQGNSLVHAGKYTEATELYRAAIGAAEQMRPVNFRLPAALNYMGLAYDGMGKRNEAIRLYRRALAILESQSGRKTPDYATVLTNLAGDLADEGNRDAADGMYREAIAIHSADLPSSDVALALCRNGYAEVLVDSGRVRAAEEQLQFAIPILASHPELRAHYAFSLNNLAAVRKADGRLDEAARLFNQSVALTEKEYGADHSKLLRPLSNLAMVETTVGNTVDAEAHFRRALSIAEMRVGIEHPDYGAILLNYSVLLKKTGHKREAKKMEARALALLRQNDLTSGRGMTVDATPFR